MSCSVASWNVNSLRVRLPQVLDWLKANVPDVLCLQETKLVDDDFPAAELEAAGYRSAFTGQKTYNGVAILSRKPASDVLTDVPGMEDHQRRMIAGTVGRTRVINLYVPNGQSVDSDKYQYKLGWLEKVRRFIGRELERHERLVVVGDFNIAPEPRDVHDPAEWEGKVLFSEAERAAFRAFLDLGLVDTFRQFDQEENTFSWWDYRAAGFRRNRGLRIDHILASKALADICSTSRIDRDPRGWERPSDHAPAIAVFGE
jgi:exodeoxyribonuclease-3